MCVCMYVCMYVCMHVCIYIYICICKYMSNTRIYFNHTSIHTYSGCRCLLMCVYMQTQAAVHMHACPPAHLDIHTTQQHACIHAQTHFRIMLTCMHPHSHACMPAFYVCISFIPVLERTNISYLDMQACLFLDKFIFPNACVRVGAANCGSVDVPDYGL